MTQVLSVKLASLLCLPFALLACSSDSVTSTSSASAMTNSKAAVNTDWIASPQKHSNSGLSMRYRLQGTLAVGQPVTVFLEFAGAKASDAQVSIQPAKALSVGAGGGLQKSGDTYQLALKPNDVASESITVTPTSEGAHFINVQLTQNGQTSASGVMLRIGQKAANETAGELVTTPSGEKLVVMPAK